MLTTTVIVASYMPMLFMVVLECGIGFPQLRHPHEPGTNLGFAGAFLATRPAGRSNIEPWLVINSALPALLLSHFYLRTLARRAWQVRSRAALLEMFFQARLSHRLLTAGALYLLFTGAQGLAVLIVTCSLVALKC